MHRLHGSALFFILKNTRRSLQNILSVGLLLLPGLVSFQGFAQTTTQTFTSSGTFFVPVTGVSSVQVEAWGGGGGGGGINSNSNNNRAGGGGGGGAYTINAFLSVTPGAILPVSVGGGGSGGTILSNGGNGGNSSLTSGATTVIANGGTGGQTANYSGNSASGTGGAGGSGTYSGGAGASSVANNYSGGGGGGAGSTGAGNTAFGSNAGAGGSGTGGGAGAAGRTGTGDGISATATFGGGGGGARSSNNTDRTGGAGAGGQIIITYILPNVSNLSVAAASTVCAGTTARFTISSSTLQTGDYTIAYNVTGASNSISSTTTTFSFTAGSPGTGTFTTAASLFTAETDVLHITRITDNSTANFTDITTSNTNFTVANCRSWYSYKNGNFNDYKSWTLDPSGTTFYNGLSLIPGNGDDITILNGKTITHNINNISLSNTIIQSGATLDMAATTGHNLGTVTGQGLLRVKGSALPSGTYTDFVSSTGGTNEFYDVGGTLSTVQTTYNNLKFTNSGASSSAVTFIEASDLTVNGTVTVGSTSANTATWQINDNSNTMRTIVLNGDLTLASGGRITAGTGNSSSTTPHSLTVYGNITNNGRVQFFDPTQAPFTSSNTSSAVLTSVLKGNAVNVTFSGTANQTVICNNQTDFYRFIVNKGTSQQAMVTVNSSAASNMRLFASASIGSTGNSSTDYSNNALSLINGTLQLTGTLTIPTLIETTTTGDGSGSGPVVFAIPQTVALWLNSPNVSVTNTTNVNGSNYDQRFLVNGQFRVSNGSYFNGGFSRGINSSAGGSVIIEGVNTVVTIWQYRPYANGTLISTYQQTGGTLNVGTTGYNSTPVTTGPDDGTNTAATDQYARFSLASSNSSFQMSGGIINIGSPTTPATGKNAQAGGLDIQSLPANYNVTGGTINMYIPQLSATASPVSGAHNFGIYSTAPLYNVNIYREGSAGSLTQAATINGPLNVLGNLTLVNNSSLSGSNVTTLLCNNYALTIGGNLTIPSNTAFYTGTAAGTTSGNDPNRATGIGTITAAGTGTITFNGTSAQTWTYSSTGTVLTSNTVVVNKSAGILSVATGNTLPSIGTLTLTSGIFNDGGSVVTVTTGLSNSATHTSGTGGSITYSAAGGTIGGNNGTFGNLILSGNNSVTIMSGNQTVTGDLRITGTGTATTPEILNIGSNNLTVNGAISTASTGTIANFGHNVYILTSGLHNAGGLTRPASANTSVLFPLGVLIPNQTVITTSVNRQYTPNTITISSATTFGKITVRAVNNTHPNVTTQSASLAYYWRVTSSGFVGTGTVTHTTYQFADGTGTAPTRAGTQSQYVAARYDRSNNTWGYFIGTGTAAAPQTQAMVTKILPDPINTATTWTGVTGSQLDGEYTSGNSSAFGTVTVYYSITGTRASPASWNANSTWSTDAVNKHTGSAATSNPTSCSTCPVVIGDGSTYNHYVSIPATGISAAILSQMCGTLTINAGSTLDCGTNVTSSTALGFGTNTTVSSTIGGTGTLRMALLGYFPSGDFTNFIGSGGGTVEYYGTSNTVRTIPSTYNSPVSTTQPLATYYNMIVSPYVGQIIILPSISLAIYNDLTEGSTSTYTGTVLTNGSSQNISVGGNLTVSYGTFNFATAPSGSTTTLNVTGNIVNNGTFSCAATTGNNQTTTHLINVFGGITNNNIMNLRQYTSGTRYNFADITFGGAGNVTFGGTGTGGTTLNLVTVNKGTSQIPTVTFSLGGTLTTTPVVSGWLTLTNGTFDFEYTGATSPITISTSSFTIPSSTQLKVGSGNVQITNASSGANDLFLNGTLQVAGGTVYTNTSNATGSSNDIEYASAGTPTIIVSGGSLTVDGSIRRSVNTLTGALVYNQTDGTVTVGGNGSDNTRGVFEIEANTGSSFTMTGNSVLNVQRQTGGTGYTDLYINPVTSSVDATSTINVGLSSLSTNTNFRVYVVPTIGNFTVVGTNAQTVNLYNNLAVGGSLTINSPSVFSATQPNPDANVTIAGDFNCTGTYTGGTNTTTFNGIGAQSAKLTTTTQFYDVTVNKPTGKVTVFGTAPAAPGLNNLNILSGTLKVGNSADSVLTSTLKVNRNITINGTQIGTQAIEVYSTSGISNAITSSGGAFTNFTLGGTVNNATVTVSGNLTINGTLNLLNNANGAINRYLNIGSGQLIFGSSASSSNAGNTAFIRTNGVASDLGVVKNWASNGTFIYPVGTSLNYTPISYSLNVTNAGTLTVVPVNSVHNTALTVSNTNYILNYYWTVTRSSALAATPSGNFTFKCPSSLLSGTTGSLVPGYLDPNALNSNGGWVTNVAGSTAAIASGTLTLTFPSTPTTDFPSVNPYYYDYSAGTTITLPNPIKGVYSRKGPATPPMIAGGGNWTTGTNWTFEVDGDPTNAHPASVYSSAYYSYPHGLPVTILPGAQINLDTDGQIAYKTTINGALYNANTTGHNLGSIDGTGTFRTATGTFPAGNYDAFVASTGGTIEYASTTTMNSLTTYNNLVISNKTQSNTNAASASTVTMTASNITVNGSLTINASGIGGSPNILDDSQNASGQGNISIAKDFINGGTFLEGASNVSITGNLTNTGTLTSVSGIISVGKDWLNTGTFNAGTGTVTFNGTGAQSTTGITTFNNLTINKSNNLTLGSVATVGGMLTLNAGYIVSNTFPATPLLVLASSSTTSGGSSSSFIDGQAQKVMNSGTSFTYPTGSISASRYRPVSIFSTSGNDTWNVSYVGNDPGINGFSSKMFNSSNMAKVSQYEYWQVANTTGTTTAGLTLSYGPGSYGTSSIGDVTKLKTARWDGTQWDIPPGGGVFSQSGDDVSGTVSVSFQSSFSPQTLASDDQFSSLPINLISFTANRFGAGVVLNWSTAQEVNNDRFEVERSSDGYQFKKIATVQGAGNSSVTKHYVTTDKEFVSGVLYYRLKQVDFDEKFSYSNVVKVDPADGLQQVWIAYPNPVGAEGSIQLGKANTDVDENVTVDIIFQSTEGRILLRGNGTVKEINKRLSGSMTDLAAGIYILQVFDGNSHDVVRIVKH